ncbi:MAG TPA: PepSY-associated TM helix domain-containing protein [Bryobacteraceae bacterium]|nr:PepSY-associated TM helix domain-containing protein [Bryobacteraceae bacterium]
MMQPSGGQEYAGNGVYINPYTGEILRKEIHAEIQTPTREILNWIGYIHFGTFAGHLSQVLWIVLGLTPGLLFITGMLM